MQNNLFIYLVKKKNLSILKTFNHTLLQEEF